MKFVSKFGCIVDFLGREGSDGSVICFWQGRGFSGDSGFILAGFLGSGLSIGNQLVCSVLWLAVLCFFLAEGLFAGSAGLC